ncbi:MAG: hypothetical protein CL477_15415 [Acidobacteria bacterium]|jgi:uncharacterized iron-regulated membrane protein|nr:hypothetical protein [Acidobacteriota bacterium]MDP7692827.1 PepSY-associated TM helix domain-containing protein [Vicinamibacterales bacterium]HJN47016.1 PepSY-associated TM helix domain-containing protein [Vicinamibacterales bacterium]
MAKAAGWLRHPQGVWLRKALFQIHLWTGLGVGIYIVVVSVTGSVLVYRSELRQRFNPEPRLVEIAGPRLSDEGLVEVTLDLYPDHAVEVWTNPDDPTHAVTMSVRRGGEARQQQFFDPYTGDYLGNALPAGWRLTTWMLDLHDNLLAGETGRAVNGVGAILLALLSVTGAIIWWPGVQSWRRSVLVDWRANWRRLNWSLHSAFGVWTLLFLFMWGFTGIYLAFPEPFAAVFDYIEPLDEETFDPRVGDTVLYWFAYLHFGRFGGWSTKLAWALIGLIPPVMFVTGAVMWWNRVIRSRTL